jgi:cysteine-rich CWC protein
MVPVTKICQACGAEFACLGGCCWCSDVTISAATRERLTAQFSDCLCRACLEAAACLPAHVVPAKDAAR